MSSTSLKIKWYKRPVIVAFLVVAIAASFGVWALSNRSSRELKNKINTYAVQSCTGSIPIYDKFNDLVTSIVSSRQAQLIIDTAAGNKVKITADNVAINHYQHDFIIGPTPAQCRIPVLK